MNINLRNQEIFDPRQFVTAIAPARVSFEDAVKMLSLRDEIRDAVAFREAAHIAERAWTDVASKGVCEKVALTIRAITGCVKENRKSEGSK